MQRALTLHQTGHFNEAEAIYRNVLLSNPSQPDALQLLGLIEKKKGNLTVAVELMERASILVPEAAPLYNNLGNTYREAGNVQKAIDCYEKALAIDPLYADCLNNYGRVFLDIGAYDKAVEKCLAAITIQPNSAETHNNLGGGYQKQLRWAEAIASYRRAIELQPDFPVAHYNLGNALVDTGDEAQAILCYREAVRLDPQYVEAWNALFRQLQATCDWSDYEGLCRQLHEFGVSTGCGNVFPFAFLAIPSTSADQQQCARLWVQRQYRPYRDYKAKHPFSYPRRDGGKLRIGYLSSDFHNHATAYLMAEVFELHDRDRFETYAFSRGADDGKDMRRRLMQAFDHFIDISTLSFQDAAQRIHAEGIDILLDLKGYTRDTGSPIMVFRPAPVQVNYVGYPGTMGADFIDYIITDRFVTPPEVAPWYDEKFAYLPDCYQPNDRQRKIGVAPSREACGLPTQGVVFCCFNHTYKITPPLFRLWCRLLVAIPGSVLWLLKSNDLARNNLLREAGAQGVDAERLVFADVAPLEQHLARMQLADVFLDTLPVNAHTTASDALWAGVPVVTCAGETFISRVAGSLLNAMGLPELVTDSLPSYEALALKLSTDPAYLAALKAKLQANRLTSPLFDSRKYTRNLEALYEEMWRRYLTGETPSIIESEALQRTREPEVAQKARVVMDVQDNQKEFLLPMPINIVHVWHDQHKPIFDGIITQLEGALRDLGIQVSRTENTLLTGSINILVGSTVFSSGRLLEQTREHSYIVYQMEPISDRTGHFWPNPPYLALLKGAAWVLDYSKANISELHANGIDRVSHVPVGYHRSLERLAKDKVKDIDVLFYGSLTPRRIHVLKLLEEAGVAIRAVFGVYGSKLDDLIERSRIVINIHHADAINTLEEVRLSFLLANHCFVISEVSDRNPYGDGVVFCQCSELATNCLYYLSAGKDVRRAIAEKGYMALRRIDYSTAIKTAICDMNDHVSQTSKKYVPADRACLFSLCWLDGADGYGDALSSADGLPPTRLARTLKWLDFYESLLPYLGVDKVIFVDDCSAIDAVRILSGNIYTPDFQLLEPATKRPWLDIVRCEKHLGRKPVKDYPYFWRGVGMIPDVIARYGLSKLIFIESDCYLLTPRIIDFIRRLNSGYCAFWSARYQMPESALTVLCQDQFERFSGFCNNLDTERYSGRPAELVLPFTHYITSGFCGDRYGEAATPQSVDMDFYAQCQVPVRMTYNMKSTLSL